MFAKSELIAVAVNLLLSAPLLLSATSVAGEIEFSGEAGFEPRIFVNDPRFEGQLENVQPSLIFRPWSRWESDNRQHQSSFVPFFRIDGKDDERKHFDIREAYWRYFAEEWEVLVGLSSVFWGVTESRHLVNIVNQIDQVEDIDGEDFLGQPMIQFGTLRAFGRFDLFVLTGFRERTFPGKRGRLRTPIPVDQDAAQFESSREDAHIDIALRYAHTMGDWDLGASYFRGTGREPRLLPNTTGARLVPHYDLINQVGADIQYTRGAWLWKFEGIVREGQGDTFGAAVAGIEYTFYQVFDGNSDLGVLAEYLRDERDQDKAPGAPFDDDLFVGARLALNDIQDTSALIGGVVDLNDQTTSFRIEAQRRIGEAWTLEVYSQWFVNIDNKNILASVRDDDFIVVRLACHF